MGNEEFVKVYMGSVEGMNRRGRPLGRWGDRVKEYMREHGSGVGCCVVQWVNRSTLRWFGYIERMENEDFVKKVYWCSVEGPNRRGKPLGRWEDRVKEYVSERGARGNGSEWARRKCMYRQRWRSVCCGHLSFGNAAGRSEASELFTD